MPVSAGLERSLIAALTSADLQRKHDLLPVPSPCPHSLSHPAFTAVFPAVSRLDGQQGEGPEPSIPEGVKMAGLVRMSLDSPEETRPFEGGTGQLQLVNMEEGGVGRATFLPGWRWSEHVKPIARTASCQADHRAYFISGRMKVVMDGGEEMEYGPGDFAIMPPGHDAWVLGDEPCVLIAWQGFADYAKR
jgi:quercetin dioxygenase-like cupin family protein